MSKRNLATMDTDMFTPIGRLLQQAMAHGITNDMVYGGLLTGQTSLQGLHVKQTTQNCSIGTRRVTWDGRVFRYGLCGADLTSMKFFVINYNPLVMTVVQGASAVAAASAGATSLTLSFSSGEIGVLGTGAVAANELYGGYISLYNSSSVRDQRMILTNTVVATDGDEMTITIDDGISAAVEDDNCEICANPYSDLRSNTDGTSPAMGMPAIDADADDYFWSQTWGICRVTPDSNQHSGFVDGCHQFCLDQFGVAQRDESYDQTEANMQNVGFCVSRSDAATYTSVAPFVMLQISP